MNFRKLIAKIEKIEKKQILKEGKDWDKDGKVEKPSQEYRGVKDNAIKKAMSKHKKESIDSNLSIAQYLLREFDLQEAEFKFSPEQEKWLGGANRQDPNIIASMPGPKPTIDYFKDPADREIAKQLNFGRQNLNTLKRGLNMQQGDAQVFGNAPDSTAGVQGSTAATAAQPDGPDGNNAPAAAAAAAPPESQYGAGQAAPAAVSSPVAATPEPVRTTLPTATKPAPSKAELSGPASGQYTIKKGDNLTKIAKANGTTIQAILAVNPQIKNPNMIYAGAKLNLPNAVGLNMYGNAPKLGQSTKPAQPAAPANIDGAAEGGNTAANAAAAAAPPQAQTGAGQAAAAAPPQAQTGAGQAAAKPASRQSPINQTRAKLGIPTEPESDEPSLINKGRKLLGIPAGGTKPYESIHSSKEKDFEGSILNRLRTLSGL